MEHSLLCCDWGTTSFRLRLMTTDTYQCVGEVRSQVGIASTYSDWKAVGEPEGVTRMQFFRQQLTAHINQLAAQLSLNLTDIPVLISGMASSSIGMDDVPYATLPFYLDGSQSSIRHFESQADFPHEISLIAGVSSEQDVMRGEETQLIGLLTLLGRTVGQNKKSIFIFPGTHSKHIVVQNGRLIHFDTYMTGELFDVMANQSILADSVDTGNLTPVSDSDKAAFRRGVRQSAVAPILNSLFTVRTNGLFNKLTKPQNALYLSGLLIGSELGYLSADHDGQLILCSGTNLALVYKLAIEELQLGERTRTISPDLIERAASVGQIRLYAHQQAIQRAE